MSEVGEIVVQSLLFHIVLTFQWIIICILIVFLQEGIRSGHFTTTPSIEGRVVRIITIPRVVVLR